MPTSSLDKEILGKEMKDLNWKDLSFGYTRTNCNIRCFYKDGQWGELEVHTEDTIPMHMAATSLHYGQECFEGLKAYRGPDNKIRLFRWEENFIRLNASARGILIPELSRELFQEALFLAIEKNSDYVPPFESGATLYIRPLLIGIGPQVGLNPSTEYLFVMFVTPVGPYFKNGFKPIKLIIDRSADRAAPLGTGHIKIGGNYASSIKTSKKHQANGFNAVLFLDPKEKKYIDECGPANFFAIKDNTYITPKSKSILPSITNKSLRQLAEHLGYKVEERPVRVEELKDFEEVGACGTAAVIAPVGEIHDLDEEIIFKYCKDDEAGEHCTKLYDFLRAIQYGVEPDPFNWVHVFD